MNIQGPSVNASRLMSSKNGAFAGYDADSYQGRAYMRGVFVAAVAAEYTHGQLYNPVGSGVVALLDAFWYNGASSISFTLARHNASLANLQGLGASKRLDAADGLCECRWESNAGTLGTSLLVFNLVANDQQRIVMDCPIIVPEGYGAIVRAGTVNVSCRYTFEWRELVP